PPTPHTCPTRRSSDLTAARLLEQRAPWLGKQVVVTAGPTREHLDPIRVVTNPSSGRMGYAIAAAAHTRGADVVLVSGPSDLPLPDRKSTRLNSSHLGT